MPTARERSCSEKEVQAIRFNHNEQRCLEKKISGLKQEGACSVQLINQTHKNIKVSYKNLKDKVSKIKTNLTVKEINDFRKMEEEGKIQVFKTIAKPDSANRISSYAKRLNIDYENSQSGAAKHSDDLTVFSREDQLSRKDILLRQISDLNDRFNAATEREREMEVRNLPRREIGSFVKEFQKLNKDDSKNKNETKNKSDISVVSNTSNKSSLRKTMMTPRASTSFGFSKKHSVNEKSRPATSTGNYKTDMSNKKICKPRRAKSVKTHVLRETEYSTEFNGKDNSQSGEKIFTLRHNKSLKENKMRSKRISDNDQEDKHEPTFKTVIEAEDSQTSDTISVDSMGISEQLVSSINEPSINESSNTTNSSIPSQTLQRSNSTKEQTKVKDKGAQSRNLKHSQSVKVTSTQSVNNVSRLKVASTPNNPKHSTPRTPNSRAISSSSVRRTDAWNNLMSSMNGPQRAPFDCHTAAEKEEKEMASSSPKSKSEGGRTKFLSNDSIEGNLGQDLHEELRKGLLEEEVKHAIEIEDKICSFMNKLDDKLQSERPDLCHDKRRVLTIEEVIKGNAEAPKQHRVERKRRNRLFEEQQKKMEMNKYKATPDSWKDVNKCRYLRIDEDKIDLSGVNTLAVNQHSLAKVWWM